MVSKEQPQLLTGASVGPDVETDRLRLKLNVNILNTLFSVSFSAMVFIFRGRGVGDPALHHFSSLISKVFDKSVSPRFFSLIHYSCPACKDTAHWTI